MEFAGVVSNDDSHTQQILVKIQEMMKFGGLE